MKSEFEWFIAVCNWEYDHLDREALPVNDIREIWQAIAARLLGLDK